VFRGLVLLEVRDLQFVSQVESYPTGLLRETFSSPTDLLAKVAAALRALPGPGQSSDWSPLSAPVSVQWRDQWPGARGLNQQAPFGAEIEIHAVPLEEVRYSARQLHQASESMTRHLRSGFVSAAAALDVGSDDGVAWVHPEPAPRGGRYDEAKPEQLLGVRLSASGQRSAWMRLPADSMGSVLDANELPRRIARLLWLVGDMTPPPETPGGSRSGSFPQ